LIPFKNYSLMKHYIFSFVLLFISSFAFSQTPCVGGTAGGYDCNGYDLMAHMPLSTFNATGANDSWGWVDPDNGDEYVLMGLEDGTAFIDISDPINPIYLGKLPTATGSTVWRDMKTYNDHVFIVSESGGHGMQIFDLTHLRNVANPPVTFTEDAHYSGFSNAHNIVINEDSGFAYAVGTDTFSGGSHFINIQDPLNPVAAGGFSADGYTHDAQVITYNGPDTDYTGSEIYIGSNGSGEIVSIVDVTNKSNPQGISTISYSDAGYTHQGWFTDDHRYFLLGDEFDESNVGFNTRTIVFDLEDLDNPVEAFSYFGTTPAIDHNGYVKDGNYYLANYAAGFRVMDISDIENGNMTEIGFFDTYTPNDDASYEGVWNVYPYFPSGNIMINDRSGGFFLVRPVLLNTNDFSQGNTFAVYPNPASNELTIKSNGDVISSISIVDMLGKTLFAEANLNSENKSIDISTLSKGIYFVNINNTSTKRIIKN